jgi:hypothetical protein
MVLRKEVSIIEWSSITNQWYFPEVVELLHTEIELEFLPEIFEDTQTLSFQDGGIVYDQDGWLHLEGSCKGHELEFLLDLIVPCIKAPVQLILTNPAVSRCSSAAYQPAGSLRSLAASLRSTEGQEEQTLTLDKNGVYDQSGHEIALDLDNCA